MESLRRFEQPLPPASSPVLACLAQQEERQHAVDSAVLATRSAVAARLPALRQQRFETRRRQEALEAQLTDAVSCVEMLRERNSSVRRAVAPMAAQCAAVRREIARSEAERAAAMTQLRVLRSRLAAQQQQQPAEGVVPPPPGLDDDAAAPLLTRGVGMSEAARRRAPGGMLPVDVLTAHGVDCGGVRLAGGTPLCIVGADPMRPGQLLVRVVQDGGASGSVRADDIRPLTAIESARLRGAPAAAAAAPAPLAVASPQPQPQWQAERQQWRERERETPQWESAAAAPRARAPASAPAAMAPAAAPVSGDVAARERRRAVAIAVAEDRAATLLNTAARAHLAQRRMRRVRAIAASRSLMVSIRADAIGETEHAAATAMQAAFRGSEVRLEAMRREDIARAHANARRLEWQQHTSEQRDAYTLSSEAYSPYSPAVLPVGMMRVIVPAMVGPLGLHFAVRPDSGAVTVIGLSKGVVSGSSLATAELPSAGDTLLRVGNRRFGPFREPHPPLVGLIAIDQMKACAAALGRDVTDVQLVGIAHQVREAGSSAVQPAEFVRIMASEELRQALECMGTHARPFEMVFQRSSVDGPSKHRY